MTHPTHLPSRRTLGLVGLPIVIVLVVIGAVWFVMFLGGWRSVPPDKVMLHYTGGPVQGTHFKEVVPPGTHTKFYGLLENFYYLPATQRTYIISRDASQGEEKRPDTVTGVSSDNVTFTFEAAVYFKLNTNPDVLRQFFEQICLHDGCTNLDPGAGWDQMLRQYFRPQIDNAVRLESGKYDREHLFHDPATLTALQTAVAADLKDRINSVLGGPFFCGPDSGPTNCTQFGFLLKNPLPPDNVVQEYTNTAAATQAVVTAQQQAAAKAAAAKGDADAQAIRASAPPLSADQIAYIQALAEQACATNDKGSCTLVITQSGGAVNINTGK